MIAEPGSNGRRRNNLNKTTFPLNDFRLRSITIAAQTETTLQLSRAELLSKSPYAYHITTTSTSDMRIRKDAEFN